MQHSPLLPGHAGGLLRRGHADRRGIRQDLHDRLDHFCLLLPLLAYFAWLTKERGLFPKVIGAGILLVSVLSSVILFDGFRFYDWIINGLLAYFLFWKKIQRSPSGRPHT